jgi:ribose transport system ATP-binding protein
VFLLDEPTQGVDIAAKAELHRELLAVADQGTAVVVGSTDVEELCNLCHRILIFSNGRVIREIRQADISVPRVTESILSSAHRSRDLDG